MKSFDIMFFDNEDGDSCRTGTFTGTSEKCDEVIDKLNAMNTADGYFYAVMA